MASGGGKPGITFKGHVVSVNDVDVTFTATNDKLSDYFKVGDEGVVQFILTPPVDPGSGQPE